MIEKKPDPAVMAESAAAPSGEIPPTVRLYEADAYMHSFTARVLDVRPASDPDGAAAAGRYTVVLDATAFFPEGGGQSADTGRIAGYCVEDVQIRADGVIEHVIDIPEDEGLPAFVPGDTVPCETDWGRRFGFMQCHSGEHILSGLMHSRYGFDNIGFHLSEHSVTLDVNGQLTDGQIDDLERAANGVVWNNVDIIARFPAPEELETVSYRSKKEIAGPLRLVTVEGIDVCACCAPHVRKTGEIGLIKILRVLRYNGGMRLTISCGSRALRAMQIQQKQAEQVSHLTNRPQEDIAGGVQKLLEELDRGRQEKNSLQARIAQLCLENARPDQKGNVWVFEDSLTVIAQRGLVNSLCAVMGSRGIGSGLCGVFADAAEKGYTYIIGSYGGADARTASRLLSDSLGARGGGKPQMVQGSVRSSREGILDALAE